MNFDPGDGDQIRLEDSGTPISVATLAADFDYAPGPGGYAFYQKGTSGVVFTSSDSDLETFDFAHFTDVV